jgi:thiol-disulfide isomerase/thioredoxin
MFFKTSCVFSMKAAPHYNALARLYPQLNVLAIDAHQYDR